MKQYILSNGIVVNEGKEEKKNLWIRDGIIHRILEPKESISGVEVIDLDGRYVFPGIIDTHVHFRQPGYEEKGDIFSESRAAAAGGVTSFFDMPNTDPPVVSQKQIEEKAAIAQDDSLINYAFYPVILDNNFDELMKIDPRTIPGIKLFTAGSTGGLMLRDQKVYHQLFEQDVFPVVAHSEAQDIIDLSYARFRERHPVGCASLHMLVRPESACVEATTHLWELAQKYTTKLHLLHVSTRKELLMFQMSRSELANVTFEVCPHYLWFSERDYSKYGNFIKCNPSIKKEEDKQFLLRAIKDGLVHTIGSDHAPHGFEEKLKDYWEAPSGISSIQHAYVSVLQLFANNGIPFTEFAKMTAHNPAKIFSVCKRGFIREGYFADLTIVAKETWRVEAADVMHKSNWSIYEGFAFKYKIDKTIVNGNIVYEDGKIAYSLPAEPVEFCR